MTWASQQDKRKVDKLVDFRYHMLSLKHDANQKTVSIDLVVAEIDQILALDKELGRKV